MLRAQYGWFWLLLVIAVWTAMATAQEVRVVYVGPSAGSVWHGYLLGQDEANILGHFTGQTYTTQQMRPEDILETGLDPLPAAVVAATNAETLIRLSAKLAPFGVAVLNVKAEEDALRRACLSNLLHITPSARMKADAVAQWQKKHPEAKVQAQAWHPEFMKFAARDLNKRFRKAHNLPMDADAWAGWAAVKMLSETVARTQSTAPARILTYLREEMGFDGQKGVPHTFRDTGQLRQPLLIVQQGKLLGEAPVLAVAEFTDLDSLGLPACPQ
jgi:hypothetical protein